MLIENEYIKVCLVIISILVGAFLLRRPTEKSYPVKALRSRKFVIITFFMSVSALCLKLGFMRNEIIALSLILIVTFGIGALTEH